MKTLEHLTAESIRIFKKPRTLFEFQGEDPTAPPLLG